jgi:hypothetical protein
VDNEQDIVAKNKQRSWYTQIDAEQNMGSKKAPNQQNKAKKPKPNTFELEKYLGK